MARAACLVAAAILSQIKNVRSKMYYDIPPYTQLDDVFELWQNEKIEEGHQVSTGCERLEPGIAA